MRTRANIVSDQPPAASTPCSPRSAIPVATRSGTTTISRIPVRRVWRRFFRNSPRRHRTRKRVATRGKPKSQIAAGLRYLLQQTSRNQNRMSPGLPNSAASQRRSPDPTGRLGARPPSARPSPAPSARSPELRSPTLCKSKVPGSQHDWMISSSSRNEQSWVPNVYRQHRRTRLPCYRTRPRSAVPTRWPPALIPADPPPPGLGDTYTAHYTFPSRPYSSVGRATDF